MLYVCRALDNRLSLRRFGKDVKPLWHEQHCTDLHSPIILHGQGNSGRSICHVVATSWILALLSLCAKHAAERMLVCQLYQLRVLQKHLHLMLALGK